MTRRAAFSAFEGGIGGERGMSINRLVAGLLAALLVLFTRLDRDVPVLPSLGAVGIYLAYAVAILLDVKLRPAASFPRRALAVVIDAAGVSFELHAGGGSSAILYPAYLWVIFGNGFRFGNVYLFAASAACMAGFGTVIATTPFWREQVGLAIGLTAALAVLPGYASVLIARLQKARRAAEEANRAKSLFLASVSHELRTPLNAIVGMGDLLGATPLDAEQAGMVSTIGTSAGVLLGLIEDLLGFSRIEAGQIKVNTAAFDLGRLLAEVRDMVSVQARAKGLVFNTHITARTPQRLQGDAPHLRQILLNLCSNAIKFTDAGSVTIMADGLDGEAAGLAGPVRLRLEVVDTGIGIAPEARKRVFELFTQADETVMNRYGGTGLGLAIVDRLVRRLGGEVGVESEVGQGSTFWVEVEVARDVSAAAAAQATRVVAVSADPARAALLAARAAKLGAEAAPAPGMEALAGADPCIVLLDVAGDDAGAGDALLPLGEGASGLPIVAVLGTPREGLPPRAVRERFVTTVQASGTEEELRNALQIAGGHLVAGDPAASPPGAAPGVAGPPLRVLVADDNPVNQMVTRKTLERAGHAVTLAGDGEQALAALADEAVDVALMDVNMPVLNGLEAAQLYQVSSLGGRRVPLLGLTADASAETTRRCLDAGMVACLVKPVKSYDLLTAVAAAWRAAGESAPAQPQVTAIAAHPRFRAVQPAPVDRQALDDLVALGGEAFLAQVAREFVEDAEGIIANLEAAAAAHDIHRFRAEAHALCSSASNLGATAIRAVCDPWQHMALAELVSAGPDLVERLRHEWRRTRAGLDQAVGTMAAGPVPSSRAP